MQKKTKKIIKYVLIIGSILAALKCIFVSIQMDEDYAMSLSYRLLQGDKLFSQVWDPHQTSAFLIQGILFVWTKLTGGTAYALLFVRCIGTLLHLGVSVYVWKFLREYTKREYAFYLAILYFNMLPKGYAMPEFSLMLAWGTTFFAILLVKLYGALQSGEKLTALSILAGLAICFSVLSYPSALLFYPFALFVIWKGDKGYRGKAALIVSGTCGAIGGTYIGYLLSYMGVQELVENISLMLSSCGSHSDSLGEKKELLLKNVSALLLIVGITLVVAFIIRLLYNLAVGEKKGSFVLSVLLAGGIYQIVHWIACVWQYEYSYEYGIYFVLIGLGLYLLFKKKVQEKSLAVMLQIVMTLSMVEFVAIMLLTNLTIFTSVKYLLIGVVAALAGIAVCYESGGNRIRILLIIWALAAIFIKGWEYSDDDGLMKNITCVSGIAKQGAAKGTLAEYLTAYMKDCDYEELQQYVGEGKRLLVINTDTMCYLDCPGEVASYTTISTPTYEEESFREYWKRNPEKYPDVIAICCWYGEMKWNPDSFIVQFAEGEFAPDKIVDGAYFRYYIRE